MGTEIGDRLKIARNRAGLTQAELAERANSAQQTINRIEKGQVRSPRNLYHLAEALGVTEEWLAFGVEDVPGSNVTRAPAAKGDLIPVISWVTAGSFAEIEEIPRAEEWRPRPAGLGARAFGLKVVGDSMTNPNGERSIPAGAIIYVDPDLEFRSGSLVIARSSNQATFKEYVEDAGSRYLKPLNPRYPLYQMEPGDEIIGVVKSFSMDL